MSAFWIVAALLLVGALLLMLPPLLRARASAASSERTNLAVHRDQLREAERDLASGLITPERFEQARADIQHRVLEDTAVADVALAPRQARRTAIALALLIPLGSVLTYRALGDPGAGAARPAAALTSAGDSDQGATPEQVESMLAALAKRLEGEPNNAEGWTLLGRSYSAVGRHGDAVIALRRATALVPGDASLLADLADVLGSTQDHRLAGEPARLVQQALAIDPRHVKALAMAGSVAFEAKDYATARRYWERLVAVLPPDSPLVAQVRGSIAEATTLGAGAVPAPQAAAAASAAGARLTGTVQISPALAARVGAGDTLFVFARAAEGPRMPLAILRRSATPPFEFALDDSMAMSPALRLSAFPRVVVGARISKSGNATPQPGDLVGQSDAVAAGATGVHVVVDRVQP